MPSFKRRRVVASSTPAPSSTSTHVLPLAPPCIEDEEVSLHDGDLRPSKRKAIDGGDGVPVVVDLSEISPEVVVQDVMVTLAEGGIGAASEVPILEGHEFVAFLRLEGDEETMSTADDGPARPRCGDASSSDPAQGVSHAENGKARCLPSRTLSELNLLATNLTLTSTQKNHETTLIEVIVCVCGGGG